MTSKFNSLFCSIVLLLLLSCAHQPKVSTKSERPLWIDNLGDFCPKGYLCAVGEAEGRVLAQAQASAGIARQFESNIKSSFVSELSSNQGNEIQYRKERIETTTDLVLSGITHPSFYESSKAIFSLAMLNKKKAAKSYKRELVKIDEEIKGLLKEASTGSLFLIEEKLVQRDILYTRYLFLSSFKIDPPISYAELIEKKRKATKAMVIQLHFEEDKPMVFRPYFGEILSNIGYAITKGKNWNRSATHLLYGKLRWEKQHLSVKGFVKYKAILTIDAQNRKGIKSGSFNISSEASGRNFKHIRTQIVKKMKDQVLNHIHLISFKKDERI